MTAETDSLRATVDALRLKLLNATTTVRGYTVKIDGVRLDEAHLQLPSLEPVPAAVVFRLRVADGPLWNHTANVRTEPTDALQMLDYLESGESSPSDICELLAVGMERDLAEKTGQPSP